MINQFIYLNDKTSMDGKAVQVKSTGPDAKTSWKSGRKTSIPPMNDNMRIPEGGATIATCIKLSGWIVSYKCPYRARHE